MRSNDLHRHKTGRTDSIDKSATITIDIPDTSGGVRLKADHVDSTPSSKTIVYLTGKDDRIDFIVTERCVIARSDRAQRILDEHKDNADTDKRDGRDEVINAGEDAEIIADGGTIVEFGDIVKHESERCRVARTSSSHAVIYSEDGSEPETIVPLGDVEAVNGDSDPEIVTDGGKPVTGQVEDVDHVPFGARRTTSVEVTLGIKSEGCRELVIKQRGTSRVASQLVEYDGHVIPSTDVVARGPDKIWGVFDAIADEIPDDAERTARRLLRLHSWLERLEIDHARNHRVGTRGYRSFREQRLVLAAEAEGFRARKHYPVVVAFNDGDVSDETVKERCDEVVESRIVDKFDCRAEAHYLNPEDYFDSPAGHPDRIRATDVIEVDSLAEADAITFEDGASETVNDGSKEDAQDGEQATLNGFCGGINGGGE